MLVRLYDLPDASEYEGRAAEAGISMRRAQPWERAALRAFIEQHFTRTWADEAQMSFSGHPITSFVATKDAAIVGFASYECTRRGYFGPTGVREDLRGSGAGTALLFACLRSMFEMGYAYAIIGGVGDAQPFYEKVCGASVIPGSEKGIYGG